MILIWGIATSVTILYLCLILSYIIGWIWLPDLPKASSPVFYVSVIIPARNEQDKIGDLLKDLSLQVYPEQLFEVILVDDHSTDSTTDIVRDHMKSFSGLRLICLDKKNGGKIAAREAGVRQARGDIIITTDGDCRTGPHWISSMAGPFIDSRVKMLAAPLSFHPTGSLFKSMQALEFLSLVGVAGGSTGIGNPVTCNAANLAFRKKEFMEFVAGTSPDSVSGDDIFLLQWMKKVYPGGFHFIKTRNAGITTAPSATLREFVRQRIRWTSKSLYYRDPGIIFAGMLTFSVNFILFLLLIMSIADSHYLVILLSVFFLKSWIDFIFLVIVCRFFGKLKLLGLFLPLQIIYFTYVSLISILGQIVPVRWKNREQKKKYPLCPHKK